MFYISIETIKSIINFSIIWANNFFFFKVAFFFFTTLAVNLQGIQCRSKNNRQAVGAN